MKTWPTAGGSRSTVEWWLSAALLATGLSGCWWQPHQLEELSDLNNPNCRIGCFAGFHSERLSRRLFPNARIVGFESLGDATVEMLGGRLEAFVTDEHILNTARRKYPDRFRLLAQALEREPAVVAVTDRKPWLLKRINEFIAEYKKRGVYDDMYLRWCDSDRFVPMPAIPEPDGLTNVLRIGTSGLIEPSTFIGENGELIGYDVEFGTRLAYWLGRRPEFYLKPNGNLDRELRSGRIDVILDNYDDAELRKGVLYSDGYLDADMKVMVVDEAGAGGVGPGWILRGLAMTVFVTLLAAALGFLMAPFMRRPSCRYAAKVLALTPPVLTLLVLNTLLPFLPGWFVLVLTLAVWYAAEDDPQLARRLRGLVQWSAIGGAVDVFELTMTADLVSARTFAGLPALVGTAFAYLVLMWTADFACKWWIKRRTAQCPSQS